MEQTTSSTIVEPVSNEDLALFNELKDDLASALKQYGSGLFEEKTSFPFSGLVNQGATCYLVRHSFLREQERDLLSRREGFYPHTSTTTHAQSFFPNQPPHFLSRNPQNSLIQSLYSVGPFREAVMAWRYKASLHCEEKDCIPLQLQKLFGRMSLSTRAAIPTNELTRSFQWTDDESFKQHDVQELCRVLFEALQLADGTTTSNGGNNGGAPSSSPAAASKTNASSNDTTTPPPTTTTTPLSFMTLIPALFSGTCADVLTCSSCGHTSRRSDAFMDLTLPVSGMSGVSTTTTTTKGGEENKEAPTTTTTTITTDAKTEAANSATASTTTDTAVVAAESAKPSAIRTESQGPCSAYTSLHRALRAYTAPETLNGSNQWLCSGCNAKVDATKSLVLTSLPPVLSLHLKRFTFDYFLGKYSKVSDPFSFPFTLTTDSFLYDTSSRSTGNNTEKTKKEAEKAESTTVTADVPLVVGSGRSAVHALRARRVSLEAEAVAALAKGEVLSEEQEEALENMENAATKQPQASSAISNNNGSGENAPPLHTKKDTIYELSAILMHSGAATAGHYFAFVRDPHVKKNASCTTTATTTTKSDTDEEKVAAANDPAAPWLLFNDASVVRLTQAEVITASGAAAGLPDDVAATMTPSATTTTIPTTDTENGVVISVVGSGKKSNARYVPSGGTAYMLLYRRIASGDEESDAAALSSWIPAICPLPEEIRTTMVTTTTSTTTSSDDASTATTTEDPYAIISSLYTYGTALGAGLLPLNVLQEFHSENMTWARLQRGHMIRKRLSEVTVYVPSLGLDAETGKSVLATAKAAAAAAAVAAGSSSSSSNGSSVSPMSRSATILPLSLQPKAMTFYIPAACTVEQACDTVYDAYVAAIRAKATSPLSPLKTGPNGEPECPPAFSLPIPARCNVRLRRYDASTRKALDTYTATPAMMESTTLFSAGLAPSTCMILEVRAAGVVVPSLANMPKRKTFINENGEEEEEERSTTTATPFFASPGLPWPEFDSDAINVRILSWDLSPNLQYRIKGLLQVAEKGMENIQVPTSSDDDNEAATETIDTEESRARKSIKYFASLSCDSLSSDGATVLATSLPGRPPATGESLKMFVKDMVVSAAVQKLVTSAAAKFVATATKPSSSSSSSSASNNNNRLVARIIILPGGIPTPDEIASGAAASRLRARETPAFTSCNRTTSSGTPGGLRVLTLPWDDNFDISAMQREVDAVVGVAEGAAAAEEEEGEENFVVTKTKKVVASCAKPMSTAASAVFGADLLLKLRREGGIAEGDDLLVLFGYEIETSAQEEGENTTSTTAQVVPLLRGLYAANTIRISFSAPPPMTPRQIAAVAAGDNATLLSSGTTGGSTTTTAAAASSATKNEYPYSITARRDETLLALKTRMIEILNTANSAESTATSTLSASSVHLRRNPRAPQLRDEERLLRDLDIGDGACLYVGHGAPLPEDSALVRVYGWQPFDEVKALEAIGAATSASQKKALVAAMTAAATAGGSLVNVAVVQVPLKQRVSALKKTIHKRLLLQQQQGDSVAAAKSLALPEWLLPAGVNAKQYATAEAFTPAHIRLRTRGGTALGSGSSGAIMRDEDVLRQALRAAAAGGGSSSSGSSSTADVGTGDDRDVILQLLPTPEVVGSSDMIIRVVELAFPPSQSTTETGSSSSSFEKYITVTGASSDTAKLTGFDDLVLPKKLTAKELCINLAKVSAITTSETSTSAGDDESARHSLIASFARRIRLSKQSAFGPKLTAWEAFNKLKWEGPVPGSVIDEQMAVAAVAAAATATTSYSSASSSSSLTTQWWDAPVSGLPLGLKDGCTLVWRRDGVDPIDIVQQEMSATTTESGSTNAANNETNKENMNTATESGTASTGAPLKPWQKKGTKGGGGMSLNAPVEVAVPGSRSSKTTTAGGSSGGRKEVGISIRVKAAPAVGAGEGGVVTEGDGEAET